MSDDAPLEGLTLAQLRAVIRRGQEAAALLREAVGEAGAPAAVAPAAAPPPLRGGPATPAGWAPLSPSELAERNRLLAHMREGLPEDIRKLEEEADA